MKSTIVITLALIIGWMIPSFAQNNVETKDIAVRLDRTTGKIELINRPLNAVITQNYQLSKLELTIFDANGEYAGTLNLKELVLPKHEVDASEQVRIAIMTLRHTGSGKEVTLTNVNFEP